MDHRDRVVVVTGASSGIGRETALAFVRRGARVVGVARREDRLRGLVAACDALRPGAASLLAGDLGERAFAERVVADTLARHGRLDVLVNNAAMPKHRHVLHLGADEAERVMRVNFLSAVWTTLAALPAMLARGEGWVVNVSSFAAFVPPPREAIYSASKAALNAWSAGLWIDLEGSNVRVSIVNPGAIDTEIWDKQDEPNAFRGRKHPPARVVDAILACVERGDLERSAPRSPTLWMARLLRTFAPALLRRGMARFDPVDPEVFASARARGRAALGTAADRDWT